MSRRNLIVLIAVFVVPVIVLFMVGLILGPLGTSFLGTKTPAFLAVDKPTVELPAEAVLHVHHFSITNTLLASWLTIIVLAALSFFLTRKMKLIPGRRQALAEAIVEGLLNFVESVAGKKPSRLIFPGIATIFLYVITNAYLGLLPFFGSVIVKAHHGKFPLFRAANTDLNLPLSIAIASFCMIEYWGMKSIGITHYIGEFINVHQLVQGIKGLLKGRIGSAVMDIFFGFINLFVGLLEIFSHMMRMLSFTFRLFGNMTAGEILLLISSFLIPMVFSIPFYGLELLIGLIQALIFSGLTLVFATIAVTPHEETE